MHFVGLCCTIIESLFLQSKWCYISCIPVSKARAQDNSGTHRLITTCSSVTLFLH